MEKITSVPSHVFYRYRAFDTLTLESLCNDELYFAAPSKFNDPFDCKPTLECDSEPERLKGLLATLIKKRMLAEVMHSLQIAGLKGQKTVAYAEKHAHLEAKRAMDYLEYMATDPDYSDQEQIEGIEAGLLTHAIEQEIRQHYERGICCFSTCYSSPLLWSHYGDQHRGLCIGYGTDRLPTPTFHQVLYGHNRTIKTSLLERAFIEKDPHAIDDLDRHFLLRKDDAWAYEAEWRLIGNAGLQASPLLMQEITFGLRCPLPVTHTVVQALSAREKPVHFFTMGEVRGSFKLIRRELDIDEISAELPRMAVSPTEEFGV